MDQLIDRARLRSDATLIARAVLDLLDPRVTGAVQKIAGMVGLRIDLAQSLSGLASETDELSDEEWSAILGFVAREAAAVRGSSPLPAYVLPGEQAAFTKLRTLIRTRR